MKEHKRNPVIRVYPQTRKKLKIIAAQMGETMQGTVERLAQAEIERVQIQKGATVNLLLEEKVCIICFQPRPLPSFVGDGTCLCSARCVFFLP